MNRWKTITTRSVCAVAVALACIVGVAASAEKIPENLKLRLRQPVQERIGEWADEKNADGINNVRGNYDDKFTKIDDDTYSVVVIKRIALADELRAERYRFTLERDGDAFKIGAADLEQKVDGLLYRSVPDDETFHAFDSFKFDREGLSLSGGKGTMIVDYWRGEPWQIRFDAGSPSYDYSPPKDTDYYSRAKLAKGMLRDEMIFTPDRFFLMCTPAECKAIMSSLFVNLRETPKNTVGGKILKQYEEANKERRKARREQPMAGFQQVDRPDREAWAISFRRAGVRDHWAGLTYDNQEPEEMRYWVAGKGTIYSYYSEQTRNAGYDPYDLELRPDSFRLDYDLVKLVGEVEMAVEDADTMSCDLTYELKIKRPLDALSYRIRQLRGNNDDKAELKNPAFRVETMTDGEGHELTFIQTGSASGWIVFPETVPAGTDLTIKTKFKNLQSIYKLNPSYSYVDRSGWLPLVNFGDMIDEFSMQITVPERYGVLGVGHRESEEVKDGLRIARFASDSPVTFPTVIFGDYITEKPGFDATKLDGTNVPVTALVDKTSTMLGSKVETWSDLRDRFAEASAGINEIRPSALKPIAEQATNSLNLFREIYQVDYPFGKLDLVNDPQPAYYGQAPASIVYLGSGVYRGKGAEGGNQSLSRFKDSVVAHEVAHQWWGGLITNANFRHYWFVESLAEYSSAMYLENLFGAKDPEKGQKAYLDHVADWRRSVLGASPTASVQDVDTQWAGEIPGFARQAAIYNQGPYAFHVLRMTFGDEAFYNYMRKLANDLKGKEITTRDIQKVAEESFGGTMEWFFDQWIRGVGIPQYQLNYDTRRAEDGNYIVEGTIRQRVVAGPDKAVLDGELFRGMVNVIVTDKKNNEYPVQMLVEQAETPFAFKVPARPVEVALNKYGEILAHDVLVNRDW